MAIYVLRSGTLVKIGFSDDLRKRVMAIIAGSHVPIEFVGYMPGSREVEDHLHGVFAGYRHSGEWFTESDEMRIAFAAILLPELPYAPPSAAFIRRNDTEAFGHLSDSVKSHCAHLWPNVSAAQRIERLAREMSWKPSRAKDLYYAHPKMVLRGIEQKEAEMFLKLSRNQTLNHNPEGEKNV